jgi:Holliday junction resolvasome RuvABC endonuclease subunit
MERVKDGDSKRQETEHLDHVQDNQVPPRYIAVELLRCKLKKKSIYNLQYIQAVIVLLIASTVLNVCIYVCRTTSKKISAKGTKCRE